MEIEEYGFFINISGNSEIISFSLPKIQTRILPLSRDITYVQPDCDFRIANLIFLMMLLLSISMLKINDLIS
jgi:hypothetical protein